jgi:hypothetical protein
LKRSSARQAALLVLAQEGIMALRSKVMVKEQVNNTSRAQARKARVVTSMFPRLVSARKSSVCSPPLSSF